MSGLATCLRARRARIQRAVFYDKPKIIRDFTNWALDNDCTHAITITPDIRPSGSFDPERELKPILRRLCKAIAHDVRGVPHRKLLHKSAIDQTVWMAGFVELYDRHGLLYPHFHGVVALRPGEDRKLKGVLANRWGKGRDVPALRPVFRRGASCPDFDLTILTDPKSWIGYGLKQTSMSDALLWTHSELLGHDA